MIRPDSGDPPKIVRQVFGLLEEHLDIETNKKGFKVLPPHMGVIYGDGIEWTENSDTLVEMHERVGLAGWDVSNLVLGMGGGLLTKHNRDTHKMAFKACAARIDGEIVEIYKDPVTGSGKTSKAGIVDTAKVTGWDDYDRPYKTRILDTPHDPEDSVMRTVYRDGELLVDETWETIRQRLWG